MLRPDKPPRGVSGLPPTANPTQATHDIGSSAAAGPYARPVLKHAPSVRRRGPRERLGSRPALRNSASAVALVRRSSGCSTRPASTDAPTERIRMRHRSGTPHVPQARSSRHRARAPGFARVWAGHDPFLAEAGRNRSTKPKSPSRRRGSNPRPPAYHAGALPAELRRHRPHGTGVAALAADSPAAGRCAVCVPAQAYASLYIESYVEGA